MKRCAYWVIILILVFDFHGCKRGKKREEKNKETTLKLKLSDKEFKKIKFKKVLSVNFLSRWCLPIEDKHVIVCDEVIYPYKKFRLRIFDEEGKLISKTALIPYGQGPTDVYGWNMDEMYLYKGKIVFFDYSYLKELIINDLKNPKIKTIMKISSKFLGYPAKYAIYEVPYTNFIDVRGEDVVMSIVPSLFAMGGKGKDIDREATWRYYIVKYRGYMEDFKIIKEVNMGMPALERGNYGKIKGGKKIFYVDRYYLLRRQRILSVDWKRGRIYYIGNIETGRFFSIDLSGKDERAYEILMNENELKVLEDEIKTYCEHTIGSATSIFKTHFKDVCYIPKRAPKILGLKVIGDYLFLLSGIRRRRGDIYENKVFVFKLPEMRYEGWFYQQLPFLWNAWRWIGNYYITRGRLKGDKEEYGITFYKYQLKEK